MKTPFILQPEPPTTGLNEIQHWIEFWLMFHIDMSYHLQGIIPKRGRMYVCNPGTVDDLGLVELLRPIISCNTSVGLNTFTNSAAVGRPILRSFLDSVEPDEDCRDRSAVDCDPIISAWMSQAEYIILQAFRVWRKAGPLDIHAYTIFPHQRLGDRVADGHWHSGISSVCLSTQNAHLGFDDFGPRRATEVLLSF